MMSFVKVGGVGLGDGLTVGEGDAVGDGDAVGEAVGVGVCASAEAVPSRVRARTADAVREKTLRVIVGVLEI